MLRIIKKIFFPITFNTILFLFLIIGIQNSSKKSKVNFLINETVNLPVSFIIGVSFISGSILGNFLSINNLFDKK
ncbi:hypothetical protein OAY04_00550 [Prochlorococcus sp. AH-736-J10]|nr:hypothetical protein [Prochlorococcus sp. AH-736-J10]